MQFSLNQETPISIGGGTFTSTIYDIIIDIKDNIESKFFNIKNKFIEKFKKG